LNFNTLKSISDYKLTEKEDNILKEIDNAANTFDKEIHVEEDIGLLGFKMSQIGKYSYIFIFCALFLTLAVVFGGLMMLLAPKKDKKNKKKDKTQ
jgi:hypothetical protein